MHNYNVDRKYQYNCRVGNWSEEWELDEYKMKEYLRSKEKQKLVSLDKEERLKRSLGGVNLSYADEGLVKFNYQVMIESDFMNAVVASNIWDKITGTEEAYGVTVSRQKEPIVRTAFQLLRCEKDQYGNDQVIHYGQNFKIAVIDRLSEKPLYLTSSHITPQKCAKFSRKQEVSISTNETMSTVWCFEYYDPKMRYEMKGQPVRAGEPILIKHIPTSQWLATDNIQYNNEFGQEFELFCHSFQTHNKTQNLIAEKVGRKTIETPMRNQYNQNTFRIITALYPPEEGQKFESTFSSTLPRRRVEISKGDLLNKLRRALMNKNGPYGLLFFSNECAKKDTSKSGFLPQETFKQLVQVCGLSFSDLDIKEVVQAFQESDYQVNYRELLNQLKGCLSEQRRTLINQAYDIIGQKLGGNITLSGILNLYRKIRHPDVIKKYNTEKEVFNDFVISWGNTNPHSTISREQFENYYHDFSSCVDKEDYFEAVLKNVWDISI